MKDTSHVAMASVCHRLLCVIGKPTAQISEMRVTASVVRMRLDARHLGFVSALTSDVTLTLTARTPVMRWIAVSLMLLSVTKEVKIRSSIHTTVFNNLSDPWVQILAISVR